MKLKGDPARRAALGLMLVAALFSGCATTNDPTPIPTPGATADPTPDPDFFFPQRPAPPPGQHSVLLAARNQGTLTVEDGCIWLRSGEERHLILWSHQHSARWFEGRIVILELGRAVARTGDVVSIGGGELTRQDVPQADLQVEATIGAKVPPQCRSGLYWRVGGIERVR